MFVANLCVYKSKKHYKSRYIQEYYVLISIYPNFRELVLIKIQISEKFIYSC